MGKTKIAITLDEPQSRSQAIQDAVKEKLLKIKRTRLAKECANLDRASEKGMAEEGLAEDLSRWPGY